MLNKKIAVIGTSGLVTAWTVASDTAGNKVWNAGAVGTLGIRAEATFDGATTMNGAKLKLQVSRRDDGASDSADPRWTDLALYNVASTGAPSAAVEWTITASAGNTVGLDLFCSEGHRGRAYFRVLMKKSGGGDGTGTDAVNVWAIG